MSHALDVLEFDAVRAMLVEECDTPMGAASAAALLPAFDPEAVWASLALTQAAWVLLESGSPPSLGGARDVRQAVRKAAKGAVLGGAELYETGASLAAMRVFREFLHARREAAAGLWAIGEGLHESRNLEHRLLESFDGSGEVLDSASPALASARRRKQAAAARVQERIQKYVSGKSRDLLSDPIVTMRDGRYVVPLKAENRGKIKGLVHDTSGSGQTLFIEPEDVLQLGNALREAEAAEREEVVRVLTELSEAVGKEAIAIADGLTAAGDLDLVFSKARLGAKTGGVVPERRQGHGIEVQEGRHPLIPRDAAVPLSVSLGFEQTALLITGPNTGGKTVAIKTVGLFALMAQAGMMPPARRVVLAPFSQVWADIGDEQSLQQSLSTFSGHVKNIAEALRGVEEGALVLFDEIGAGTDPAEGAALAKAVLGALQSRGARILASTHYGELKAFAYNAEGFANAAMEFDAKSLRPTYRLLMGAPGASHALKIAERCGMPSEVVDAARSMLGDAAMEVSRMMEHLESAQKQARVAQSEADRRVAEIHKREAEADRKLGEAQEVRRKAHERATAEIEETLRQIRLEAATLFDELKRAGASPAAMTQARKDLEALQESGREVVRELQPEGAATGPSSAPSFKKGDSVRVEGYPQIGTLLDAPHDGHAKVQVGSLKLNVQVDRLRPAEPAKDAPRSRGTVKADRAQFAPSEIHLRAMRAEDAERELQKFLDDAVLSGLHQVRIVHGKGEGVLRSMCRAVLRKYPHVARYRDGESTEGGQGVTIAILEG